MATYTLVQALAQTIAHSCDDGSGNIYILASSNDKVYKYNIGSDTLTDVSGATFTGMDTAGVIAYFNGNVYVVVHNTGSSKVQVYRYDNSGTSWTLVHNAINTGGPSFTPYMDADSSRIIYSAFDGAGTRYYYASTNGTVWAAPALTQSPGNICYNDEAIRGGVLFACGAAGAIDIDECCWSALNAATFANRSLKGTGDSQYSFFGNSTVFYYSTDWGQNTNAIAGTWYYPTQPNVWELASVAWAVGLANGVNRDQVRTWNGSTLTFDLDGTPSSGNAVIPRPTLYGGYLYVVVSGVGVYVRDAPLVSIEYTPNTNAMYAPVGMDVSADDYYLYIACLFGGNPVLLRMLSDLTADPIEAYAPGAGSAIGVKCGDENESWVWIAGDFGTPLVRLSIDDGVTWTTKDPGTWGGVALPMVIGPWWDDLVLVPTDGDDDMHETEDGGLNWSTLNSGLPFDIGAMDRLDIDLDEIIIGSDAGRDLQFSPSNAAEFWDITDAGMPNVRISDIIVG